MKAKDSDTGVWVFLSALHIMCFIASHLKSFVSKELVKLRVTSVNEKKNITIYFPVSVWKFPSLDLCVCLLQK